jgi:hypothetical protein
MQHGIPAVMFITWPDNWYHSSQDTPDKQGLHAVGAPSSPPVRWRCWRQGGDEMAARVLSENLSRGAERMGESCRKAMSYIADAGNAASLAAGYRDAIVTITHQANVEKGVVRSARVLFDSPADAEKKVQVFEPLIDKRAAALLDEVKAAYALQAAQHRTAAAEPSRTPEEREASTLAIECVNGASFSGCSAAPGAAGGRGAGPGGGGGRRMDSPAACRST